MGEKKFTFIELHLDGDTQFGPKRIGDVVGEESDVEEETDEAAVPADDEDGGRAIGVLVALVVLAGIALAVRKFRGDEDEAEVPPEEEPDIIVN